MMRYAGAMQSVTLYRIISHVFGLCMLLAFTAVADGQVVSPRLLALEASVRAGEPNAVQKFWSEVNGNAPLVEDVRGEPTHRLVTFLWRGEGPPTTRVAVFGGLPAPDTKLMVRLHETNVWYWSEKHPADARFQYSFIPNVPAILPVDMEEGRKLIASGKRDSLNRAVYRDSSFVELPNAPRQDWVMTREGTQPGVATSQSFKSEVLSAEYKLTIYVPKGYDQMSGRAWLLVAFDGGFPDMIKTMDSLAQAGKIPPVVVIGVNNVSAATRRRDLGASDAFLSFLTNELVPWARKTYKVFADPEHTIIGGYSRGGLMALYSGLKGSAVFGNVLSLSAVVHNSPGKPFPIPDWMEEPDDLVARQFARSVKLPLNIYMEVGRYEALSGYNSVAANRRLRDVLEAKGYTLKYDEFNGGHDYLRWRSTFADGLRYLTGSGK
jgi:enterochelin esterase family protein